jgi:5'-3' exonuclease
MKKKFKGIVIDADFLIFEVCEGSYTKVSFFGKEKRELNGKYKEPLTKYKERFHKLVDDIVEGIHGNLPGEVNDKVKLCFSDPDNCFRYDIYPEYKGNRESGSRSKLFYRLRKWVLKKYGYGKNLEADDVVAHYVRKGWVGATFDKDLIKGVAGTWFDTYHSRRYIVELTYGDAFRFNLIQALAGDPTDNIKGIPRVGEKTAIKLLTEFGWDWDGVIKAYESKGLTKKDALLNVRLTNMEQWSPKKGLKLFKFKKRK